MRVIAITRLLFAAILSLAGVSLFGSGRVAVLPLENLSATESASGEIQQKVIVALRQKGWDVATPEEVNEALEAGRIRYVDSLDDEARKMLLAATHATAYVAGSVYAYENGRNPVASFSVRMVRTDGSLAWGDVGGVAATDTEKIFGFGRARNAQEAADAAVARMASRMPTPATESRLQSGPSRPLFHAGPANYSATGFDTRTPHLVCVLPLENRSATPEAARVVAEILSLRLAAASGFEVVDPAKVRSAALAARIPSFFQVPNAALVKLAPLVGTPLFLRGTIFGYSDITGRGGSDPAVQLELTLVDVAAGRVVWTSQHEREGSDYEGLLLLGAASNAAVLTDRVVSEMIEEEVQRASRSGEAYATARGGQKRLPTRHSELRDSQKDGENR